MVLPHVRVGRWQFVEHAFVSVDADRRHTFGAFTSKRDQPRYEAHAVSPASRGRIWSVSTVGQRRRA
jgi:hypothetical protein